LGDRLEIGEDALDRLRARVASVSQIENKTWISNGFASESGWGSAIATQEFFYFSQQMHQTCPC
jgi:hypothetical protein